jgi:hypothetical protein
MTSSFIGEIIDRSVVVTPVANPAYLIHGPPTHGDGRVAIAKSPHQSPHVMMLAHHILS